MPSTHTYSGDGFEATTTTDSSVTLDCGHEKTVPPGLPARPGTRVQCLECKPKRIGHPAIRRIQ